MRDDPFAKLGALDQKLFDTPAKPAAPPVAPQPQTLPPRQTPSQGTKETWDQASKEASKEGTLETRTLAPKEPRNQRTARSDELSLNIRPERQNTYAFTTEELNRLEDVKIAISRRYDLPVTKNDLIRCAVHLLLEDYEVHGADSVVLKRLQKKKAR